MDVIEVTTDTCDACPAEAQVQAYVYATHPDWPSAISYCAHHGTEYRDQLTRCNATIIDLTHRLHE